MTEASELWTVSRTDLLLLTPLSARLPSELKSDSTNANDNLANKPENEMQIALRQVERLSLFTSVLLGWEEVELVHLLPVRSNQRMLA